MSHFGSKANLVNISEKTYVENRFQSSNCLKGCKWAPDGSCLCTNSDDHCIRIFDLPSKFCNENSDDLLKCDEIHPILKLRESQIIYDFCWYPLLNSLEPATCFLLCTSNQVPIHLWDAYNGKLSASYFAENNVNEIVSARSAQFTTNGSYILAGYEKFLCMFDVSRPGSNGSYIYDVPNGIISSIACSEKVFAVGTYNKFVSIFDLTSLENIVTLQGHKGGITHLMISSDGNRLFSGARKDQEILCWDLRNPGTILQIINRNCPTSQRIYFDIDFDKNLFITGDDSYVRLYDLNAPTDANKVLSHYNEFMSHENRVTGVSLHPTIPLIATTSGERYLMDFDETDDNIFDYNKTYVKDNNMKLWWCGGGAPQMSV